jgi:hypothetical protein
MTRRLFLGMFLPSMGMTREQFSVSGHFDIAGAENEGYYALGQNLSLFIDPRYLPAMKAQADKLVGKQARIVLEGA